MHHLTKEQLRALRDQLLKDKARLEAQLAGNEQFGLADSLGRATGELSSYDNHPADLGTEVYERGKDIALNENAEERLAAVNRALRDMETGQYGICKATGQPIPYERLEALPTAESLVEATPEQHVSKRRPAEERLLRPPFGRSSLDEHDDQTQFDGEDAWQIVESWGTSNTPAMAEDPQITDYDEMAVEAEEKEGFVEPIESFLATDLYGKQLSVVRNKQYREYMDKGEGEPLLEPDPSPEEAFPYS